jgi:aspartate racemase
VKVIGLIGGLSWESSAVYYRIINEAVRDRLGGAHSARCLMYSVDFAEFERLQHQGEWNKLTELMVDAGWRLKRGGAEFIVICTNTMHKMADEIEKQVGLPLLHIADAAAAEVKKRGLSKVALLGTKFTMEQDFYKKRLAAQRDIVVMIPELADRETIHSVIYNELVLGKILPPSHMAFKQIIERMRMQGAEGIVLGCTEIPLLIGQTDSTIPVFDTTKIHALAAVDYSLT